MCTSQPQDEEIYQQLENPLQLQEQNRFAGAAVPIANYKLLKLETSSA